MVLERISFLSALTAALIQEQEGQVPFRRWHGDGVPHFCLNLELFCLSYLSTYLGIYKTSITVVPHYLHSHLRRWPSENLFSPPASSLLTGEGAILFPPPPSLSKELKANFFSPIAMEKRITLSKLVNNELPSCTRQTLLIKTCLII